MILYFSGTGNSEYVAKRIGAEASDKVISLFDKIRNRDYTCPASDRPWVVVVPTYAWRIPRIVQEWLEKTELSGSRDIYFVMTCGGSIGNAGAYLRKWCESKNLRYRGCAEIVMPENYIALFQTPDREEALAAIGRAEERISTAAQDIRKGAAFSEHPAAWKDKISSGPVNVLFYPLFVHAKKFYATDACISCGKCVKACPLENIRLQQGRPSWGNQCTHCMACICRCPAEAIEYGSHSRGLPRYVCPKKAD